MLERTKHNRTGGTLLAVLAFVVISAIGIGSWIYYRQMDGYSASENEPIVEAAKKGPFDHVVLEQGDVESSSNNEVKCMVEARGGSGTPILWVIDEGSYVKKGDKLCELDSSALENEMKAQRIVVSASEALVISSDAALKQAEIAKQEYLEGTYETERRLILSEINVAEQEKRKMELSLASAERLAAKGTLRPLQIQAEQFAVQNSKNNLDAAKAKLEVLDNLTKKKMLVQLESTIETARAKLESDRSTLLEEQQKLDELKQQIANCTITAPADGQVVHANLRDRRGSSEFVVEAGAMVRELQTLFLLPDPNKMQVRAKVNESRITLIREGMPVKIKVGQQELIGRVSKVNKYAEAGGWMTTSVKEYATLIEIMNPPPTIRTGMTAEVRIFVEQIEDALQVPVHAIYETKGHHLVVQKKGMKYETKEVEIGATNERFVTIKNGLSDGDLVVLNPRQHQDIMEIPQFADVNDRDKLIEIGKEAPPASASTEIQPGPQAGPAGTGQGPPGAGGARNPAQIVEMILGNNDKDGDGKISKEEAAADDRFASRFAERDKNNDGFVDRQELMSGMRNFGGGGGQGGGGPGGFGGPPR
jgi:RND family efflux transporter MFP subunit